MQRAVRQKNMQSCVLLIVFWHSVNQVNANALGKFVQKNDTLSESLMAQARKEALKQSALAFQQFKNAFGNDMADMAANSIALPHGGLFDVLDTAEVDTKPVHVEQETNDTQEEWSVLDSLPDCANQTVTSDTLCIYKNLSQVYNELEEGYGMSDGNTTRKARPTRELPPPVRRRVKRRGHRRRPPPRGRGHGRGPPWARGQGPPRGRSRGPPKGRGKGKGKGPPKSRRGGPKGRRKPGKGGKKGPGGKKVGRGGKRKQPGLDSKHPIDRKGRPSMARKMKGGKGRHGKGRKGKMAAAAAMGGAATLGKKEKPPPPPPPVPKRLQQMRRRNKKTRTGQININSRESQNRLYGYPDQIKEQKRRMEKYKSVYSQFNEYHVCMRKKASWYRQPTKGLQLHFKVEGQEIRLSCNVCLRPDEDPEDYDLQWKRRPADKTEMEELNVRGVDDEKEDGRFSWIGGGVMVISDLTVDDTGQYVCLMDNEYEAVHIVEVALKEPTRRVVGDMLKKEGKGQSPAQPVELKKNNLYVYTKWEPWSPCSRCDARGVQKRFGVCNTLKIEEKLPVKPQDAEIFKIFPDGLPCHSNFLPESIQRVKGLLTRKSEVHTKYCYQDCPKPPVSKTVKGKSGEKVKVLKSTKGFRKLKSKFPKIPPRVRRKTIYVEQGDKAEVTCVRKIRPTSIVRWQKGYRILDPLELPKVTHLRMKITATNKLLMSDVKMYDTAIYSCWIDGVLRKTTKIKVFARKAKNVKNKIVYLGLGITAIVVLLILKDIGKNRQKGRQG